MTTASAPRPGRGAGGHREPREGGGFAGEWPPAGTPARIVAGRYRLAERIGHGGMGVVWRARDQLLDRDVAVKEVTLPTAMSEPERASSYQRTLREARTAAQLNHPSVAAVHDVVEERGRPWIVMELVPGRSLDRVIAAGGPLTPRVAAHVGRQVAAALAAAHEAGVLHRDVKPGNVLLAADGRAVLADFGIAIADRDPSLTQAGIVLGSPGYLAPERIHGCAATPASDMWSLGATLYAAVEGKGPYDDHGSAAATMAAVLAGPPRPPRAAGPLGPVLSALLSRDPARRPPAAAAAAALGAVADGVPGGGPASHQPVRGPAATLIGVPTAAAPAPGPGAGGTLRLTPTLPPPPLPPVAAPGRARRPARRRRFTAVAIAGIALLVVAGVAAHAHPVRAGNAGRSGAGPGIGSSVRDGKFQFTVTGVSHATSAGDARFGLAVRAQGEYTLVHVTVTNIGSRSQVLTDTAQYVYDAAGRKYSASSGADIDLDGGSVLFNAISPGNTVRAVFAFDMPAGVRAVKIELHDSLLSGGVTVSLR